MEELINRMNVLLADSYQLYLKSASFHWNVKGPNFPQYHDFFGNFYDEVYGSIDTIAEFIRALDGIPQNTPSFIKQNANIVEQPKVLPANEMFDELAFDVQVIIKDIMEAMSLADRFREVGLSNFLQDRHAAFKKHAWMLKSITSKA